MFLLWLCTSSKIYEEKGFVLIFAEIQECLFLFFVYENVIAFGSKHLNFWQILMISSYVNVNFLLNLCSVLKKKRILVTLSLHKEPSINLSCIIHESFNISLYGCIFQYFNIWFEHIVNDNIPMPFTSWMYGFFLRFIIWEKTS